MLEIFRRAFRKKKAKFELKISITHTPPDDRESKTIEAIYEGETGMSLSSIKRAINALMVWVFTENGIGMDGRQKQDWTEVEKEEEGGWAPPGY